MLRRRWASHLRLEWLRERVDGGEIGDDLDPFGDLEDARDRLDAADGLDILHRRSAGRPETERIDRGLARLECLEPSLSALERGEVLAVVELVGVREMLTLARRLHEQLADAVEEEESAGPLQALSDWLGPFEPIPELRERLARAIEDDGPDGEPVLSDDASPELRRLRRDSVATRRRLVSRVERMVKQPEIAELLQDAFWTLREGRVVIPAKAGSLGPFKRDGSIVHGASASGRTMFVEPRSLVDDNNALREQLALVAAEERRVLADLSQAVRENLEGLRASEHAAVRVARLHADLKLSAELEGTRPRLCAPGPDAVLSLPRARHPLLVLRGEDVVPNDLNLRSGSAMVVTGPNAGGKTVALKTVGLCVLMARAGLRIPTDEGASVIGFGHVVTDVGDDQSIQSNLSTFSAHLRHVMDGLSRAADPEGTLVLLDEIAVGTDPEQGAALAEAVLRRLVEDGATVMVTTHYERLKLLAADERVGHRFANASVGFDMDRLRPTFELRVGVPGSSSAIAVARRLGMPETVLGHAESLLDDAASRVDVLLQAIEQERVALDGEREALSTERQELDGQRRALERAKARAESGARTKKEKAYAAAQDQLRELERELKARRRALRRAGGDPDRLPTSGHDLGRARGELRDHREPASSDESPRPPEISVGVRVRVPALGEGEVVALKGKRATVQLPNLRTTVAIEELRVAADAPPAKRVKRGRAAPVMAFTSSTAGRHFGADARPFTGAAIDNTIDLRGARVDEATTRLEAGLAEGLGRGEDIMLIRHGHGSGALRSVVRETLRRLPHVHRQRGGLPAEGGDAITLVWLK